MLNQKVYRERYKQAEQLCRELLDKKLTIRGKSIENKDEDLILSVLASIPVADLIMKQDFNRRVYESVLLTAIEETRKELFPDLAKKRFISLEIVENHIIENEFKAELQIFWQNEYENNLILRGLPEKSKVYIEKLIKSHPHSTKHLQFKNHRHLLKNVSLITQLFPDQQVPCIQNYTYNQKLSEQQIIDVYKCVLSGIEKSFPVNFLKTQARYRAKVMLRYLFNDLLCINDPQELLCISKELLTEYKLVNVLRFFNYSVKQVLHNAYPEKFPSWHGGKTANYYWKKQQNRISAIRWLVEIKKDIDPDKTLKIQLNKNDFSRYGLSYMFNTYYNSTAKALNEAYPTLKPWQTGSLPIEFWSRENIKTAVYWMLDKLDWKRAELPLKYNNGFLTRKTFSRFGLSGLFENKFNCKIFNLADYIWPGKFKEWEFGNMNTDFWNSVENRKKFAGWFTDKFTIKADRNQAKFTSLQQVKEYRFYTSLYKYCKGNFNRLLEVYELDLAEQNKSRQLLRKWNILIRQEKVSALQSFLSHGLFTNMVKIHARQRMESYQRMKTRLEKRVE